MQNNIIVVHLPFIGCYCCWWWRRRCKIFTVSKC